MAHFTVTVCTAKRPQMLSRNLESLNGLLLPPGCSLSIVVVENDLERKSVSVIDRFRKLNSVPINYYLEPKIGIPHARNRAIEAAIAENADWIAMLDDDEYAKPDWLLNLFDGCIRFKAEVATGPVTQVTDAEPPHWWQPPSQSRRKTGEIRRDAFTNNVLVSSRIVAPDGLGLRFDDRLTFGAEDVDFFRRAYAKGARIVFVTEAIVVETVPASRLTFKRILERTYMVASAAVFLDIMRDGYAMTLGKRLPHGLRRLCLGTLLLLVGACLWPLLRSPGEKAMLKGLISITKAWGSLSPFIGRTSTYYQQVDGA